uniref:Paraoxonase n=1 Tax=Ascaris suum TaxID=6253 RepID=F1L5L8_ASCSU
MKNRIVIGLFLGFGCSSLIRFMLLLDLNKRVYNHSPGSCRIVRNVENGSAGIEYIREFDIALITSGYAKSRGVQAVTGQVLMYDFSEKGGRYETKKLKIQGVTLDRKSFVPHGISSFVSKGRVSVYITSSRPGNHTVEVFQFNKERLTLVHRKTIADSKFNNLADIAVVGADRFFVTNFVFANKRWMQLIELALQSSFGSIVYYDGKKSSYLEKYIPSPNGIAFDSTREYLYVASSINEFIRVYKVRKDMSVEHQIDIHLLSSPNKLFVEYETGDVWVALHPVVFKAYAHIQNPTASEYRSPSQVLRIRIQDDRVSWVITEPYANDGATIWGSSAVVFRQSQMLIGSLFGRLLHCDIDNPQLV